LRMTNYVIPYWLMDNYYHLLIKSLDVNLSQALRQLNAICAQKFNKIHNINNIIGFLFQERMLITLLLFFMFMLNGTLLEAKRILEVEGRAEVRITGITPEEGWRIAKRRARADAIEKASGIRLLGSTVVKNGKLIADYIKTLSRGLIIGEKIIKQEGDWIKETKPWIPVYKIAIKAKVAIPENKRKIRLFTSELNKFSFLDGEKAQITIFALDNVYISIFNISADDKVKMLYPNPYMPYKIITPNKKYVFPDPDSGVRLQIMVTKGHKEDTEAFFIIGLPAEKQYRNVFSIFKNKKTYGLSEFFKLLCKTVDIDAITDEFLPYSVKARKRDKK